MANIGVLFAAGVCGRNIRRRPNRHREGYFSSEDIYQAAKLTRAEIVTLVTNSHTSMFAGAIIDLALNKSRKCNQKT